MATLWEILSLSYLRHQLYLPPPPSFFTAILTHPETCVAPIFKIPRVFLPVGEPRRDATTTDKCGRFGSRGKETVDLRSVPNTEVHMRTT